ncbi:TPA: hypothetical protein SMI12_001066 [Serratia liquefaciens]|nr:hypothetical protein [Serratia liquefaciens]
MDINKAHNRASGFFVCDAQLYPSMVGWVGEPKGSPGSFVDRSCKPHSAHHQSGSCSSRW